jgi:transposase
MQIKRKDYPKIKKVNPEEISSLLERMRSNTLTPEDHNLIANAFETLQFITEQLQQKNARVNQLLKQILGIKSEKSSKVLLKAIAEQSKSETDEVSANSASSELPKKNACPKKRKGHGRNGVEKYTGAENVWVAHGELKSGHDCPGCSRGKVYNEKNPGVFIHIEGKPPIHATIYETEKLRCNLCGEIFEADLPVEAPAKKHYDETAKSMMAVLRYGYGLPLHRLEKLQADMGIPLPASTAWDKTQEAAEKIVPVHEELIRMAAQGEIIHNDDTGMKILKTMEEIEKEVKEANGKKIRTGIFTTGIVSVIDDNQIALFFTGRKHAGENFDNLLKERESDRSPPVQMCDGKNGNTLSSTSSIVCNCNVHARRYFVDVSENFPDETTYVILDVYREIYKNDACARKQKMSPEQRQEYHQENSGPIMDEFHLWLKRQFDEKLVEENSSLGKAISYTLNRWSELTRFLYIPGAPLDNNICEQALKRAICHRKNSLFYKTENGANVGDMFMSLIHTCYYAAANPFDYFTQLQRYSAQVAKEPSKWLPWNYRLQLELLSC